MKNIFIISLILIVSGMLSSSQLAYSDKDFIGAWKVKTVIKNNGMRKKGDMIITFNEDQTTISEIVSSHQSSYGKWSYSSQSQQLMLTDQDSRSEIIDVNKIAASKMELLSDGNIFKLVRVNSK